MFDAVYAHYGLIWQFWKNDIASEHDLAKAITVTYKVAVIPILDAVDDNVHAICAANSITIEQVRLIGHNNDGKGVEMLVQLAMQIFERWTGITPEEAVFQRAVAEALGK
jgi:shikimate dehydrogenase